MRGQDPLRCVTARDTQGRSPCAARQVAPPGRRLFLREMSSPIDRQPTGLPASHCKGIA
jgi:hypothetical protein